MERTSSFRRVFPEELLQRYRYVEVRNASAVLHAVAPEAVADLQTVLAGYELTAGHLLNAGGSKSEVARQLDLAFRHRGWRETHLKLDIRRVITRQPWHADDRERKKLRVEVSELTSQGQTHKVDNFRDRVAIEVEWNAKDGNLDRDLSAFRALHEAGVIDAAVMVTRHQASTRHAANYLAAMLGRERIDSQGKRIERFSTSTTTNIERLSWRLARGDAGGCPVLGVAISLETYVPGRTWKPDDGEAVNQPVIPALPVDEEQALEREVIGATEPGEAVPS